MSEPTASRLIDWSLLILCNLIWASQFVLAKLVQEEMGPIFATLLPMTIATLCLFPLVRRQQRRRREASGMEQAAAISAGDVARFALRLRRTPRCCR